MNKLRKLFINVRVIILVVSIILAYWAISPEFTQSGVQIRGVLPNSTAAEAGLLGPEPNAKPMSREKILTVNARPVNSPGEFFLLTDDMPLNRTITIKTNRQIYMLKTRPLIRKYPTNETETKVVTEVIEQNVTVNGTLTLQNVTVNKTVTVPVFMTEIIGTEPLGIRVGPSPMSNLRLGLDLQGGTRVILQPETRLPDADMESLIANMKRRLNLFGLSDLSIRKATESGGGQLIIVEIAGVNEDEIKQILSSQGKFEAKIGNQTVFRGGNDIIYVCRTADCAGIDPVVGCQAISGGNACRFRFAITISQEAAQRQADATRDLEVIFDPGAPAGQGYLSLPLDLYLDDQLVDTLQIGEGLRGVPSTNIQISGSGAGLSEKAAEEDAIVQMKQLQTVLITGSLPVKLEIMQTDNISAALGKNFIQNAFLVGLAAIIAVLLILLIVYRNLLIAGAIMVTAMLEVYIMLGISAIIGQNIDLAAIAGIIAVVGTGVDDQIIIIDEAKRGESRKIYGWTQKLKSAFFIIFGAYITLVLAMMPLLFTGAGLLRGFALVTIIGVSVGVFITRPAFAHIVRRIIGE